MTRRFHRKLARFARFASDLSTLSTCGRSSVGCVVVLPDFTEVLAIGYNGPRKGASHDTCQGPEAVGSCGCVHAEANALVRLSDRRDAMLITTMSPCRACADLIVNRGTITHVEYIMPYRDADGVHVLRSSGITCSQAPANLLELR